MKELVAKRIRPVLVLAARALMIVSSGSLLGAGGVHSRTLDWYSEGALESGLKVVSSEKADSPRHYAALGGSDEILWVAVKTPLGKQIRVAARFLLGRYGNLWEVVDVEGDENEFLRVGCQGW